MSKLPVLHRGQKYDVFCPVCNKQELLPGTVQMLTAAEHTGDPDAFGQVYKIEFQCQRQTCKATSHFVIAAAESVTAQWNTKDVAPRSIHVTQEQFDRAVAAEKAADSTVTREDDSLKN